MACGTRISAPPAACMAVILDAASYPRWNRFCRSCIIEGDDGGTQRLGPGSKFTFDVHMGLDEEVDAEEEEDARGQEGGEQAARRKVVTGRATALEISVLEAFGGGDEKEEKEGGEEEGALGDDVNHPSQESGYGDGSGAGKGGNGRTRRKGWRVAWKTRGMPGMMLRSERVQDFFEAEDGSETDYVCWETFYGILAPVVRLSVGAKLERGFGAWTDDLKARVESLNETETRRTGGGA